MFSKIAEEVQIKTTELFHIESALNNLELVKISQARLHDIASHDRTIQIIKDLTARCKSLREEIEAVVA